jgi:hypothetical protein
MAREQTIQIVDASVHEMRRTFSRALKDLRKTEVILDPESIAGRFAERLSNSSPKSLAVNLPGIFGL